jgi:hypothetical protein
VIDDAAARDSKRAAAALEIDPDRSNIIVAIGRKGSGKSEALRQIFNAWPYDRVVVDVTGDARPDDPDTITVTAPVPAQLPEPPEGHRRVTVWARLDPRRPTYVDDQDDALRLGLYPRGRNTLLWADEYAQMATAAKVGPNLRLALQSSRHYHLSLLLAFPRPRFVPRMTFEQADHIFVFKVPDRDDRETIAKNIGYPTALFEQRYAETMRRGDHAFLLWDSRQGVLFGCPHLPLQSTHGPRA